MNPVKRKPSIFWMNVEPDKILTRSYNIQKNFVESSHDVRLLGVFPRKYEYLSVRQTLERESSLANQLKNRVYISLDTDAIETVRSVYTIWDALGETGGLIDILKVLG